MSLFLQISKYYTLKLSSRVKVQNILKYSIYMYTYIFFNLEWNQQPLAWQKVNLNLSPELIATSAGQEVELSFEKVTL